MTPGSTPAKFPTKLRRNTPRTKTGCLTCRQRKKKCDEAKPRCSGCSRNELECTWSEKTLVIHPRRDSGNESDSPQAHAGGTALVHVAANADPLTAMTWSEASGSFMSPHRAALLTSKSSQMLKHYIFASSTLLSFASPENNPYVSVVLPLAYVDDLLMHCVTAIGGALLSCRHPESVDLQTATHHHYSCVLQGLQASLRDLQPRHINKVLRILLVLAMLSTFEGVSISCADGGVFSHLRASRQLIMWLLDEQYRPTAEDSEGVFGFVLEIYAYSVLVNEICPHGLLENRAVVHDEFILSLELLSGCRTSGVVFFGYHLLLGMIPEIAQLAGRRVQEGETDPSENDESCYAELDSRIRGWQNPGFPLDNPSAQTTTQHNAMGEVYRHALWIFLETAMNGSSIPNQGLRDKIGPHLESMASQLLGYQLPTSRVAPMLLWPIIIAGSIVLEDFGRILLSEGLRNTPYLAWSSIRAAELLELLWADDDPRAYGPYGLYLVMKKHNINFCVS